jgi:hypothetical protein
MAKLEMWLEGVNSHQLGCVELRHGRAKQEADEQ